MFELAMWFDDGTYAGRADILVFPTLQEAQDLAKYSNRVAIEEGLRIVTRAVKFDPADKDPMAVPEVVY